MVVGLVVAAANPATQLPPPGARSPGQAAIDRVLADAIGRHDVPGVVAIATDRRGVIYEGAVGMADATATRPMTLDAIFRIASLTKPITSVAAMQLVEQGRVNLDDPAAKHLPSLGGLSVFESFDSRTGAYRVRPAVKTLTVRHLLTHTSGLGYNFTSPVVRDFKPRDGEQYGAGPLLFEPGEQWLYGTSTDWVGRLVESISGKTLDAYFRERILDPLAMADTSYNVPEAKRPRLVAVHRRQPDGSVTAGPSRPPAPVARVGGGGGLSSVRRQRGARRARQLRTGRVSGRARFQGMTPRIPEWARRARGKGEAGSESW